MLFFSCSVAVKNIERQIFILPREKVKKKPAHGSECFLPLKILSSICFQFHDMPITSNCSIFSLNRSVMLMVLRLTSLLDLLMYIR